MNIREGGGCRGESNGETDEERGNLLCHGHFTQPLIANPPVQQEVVIGMPVSVLYEVIRLINWTLFTSKTFPLTLACCGVLF